MKSVAEISPAVQAKLLRGTGNRAFPACRRTVTDANVRIVSAITATCRWRRKKHSVLIYGCRLNGFTIQVPPLRGARMIRRWSEHFINNHGFHGSGPAPG
ncbi:MAG: hypothetical protein R3E89_14480 [Thiolinea sp.]